MTDPRNFQRDPRLDDPRYREMDDPGVDTRRPSRADAAAQNAIWGWVTGIVAVIFIIAIVYGFSNQPTNTATNTATPPATTTGSGTAMPTPPRNDSNPAR